MVVQLTCYDYVLGIAGCGYDFGLIVDLIALGMRFGFVWFVIYRLLVAFVAGCGCFCEWFVNSVVVFFYFEVRCYLLCLYGWLVFV